MTPSHTIKNSDTEPLASLSLSGLSVTYLDARIKLSEEYCRRFLHPDECIYAEKYTNPGKRLDFLRSRYLLHQSIPSDFPLLHHAGGDIAWPGGTIGSLSHKNHHIFMASAPNSASLTIGLDLELIKSGNAALLDRIATDSDLIVAEEHNYLSRDTFATLLFSAKESLFKALYPLGRTLFYFKQAQLCTLALNAESNDQTGRFSLILRDQVAPNFSAGTIVSGEFVRILFEESYILSCINLTKN